MHVAWGDFLEIVHVLLYRSPISGGSFFDMSNGNQLKLIVDNSVNVRSFGIIGSESTDLTQFQACANFCAANNKIMIGDAGITVILSNRFTSPSNLRIEGGGMLIKASPTNPSINGTAWGITTGSSNIHVQDVIFDGGELDGNTNLSPLTRWFSCSNVTVTGCKFQNSDGIANNISTNCSNLIIDNNDYEAIGFQDGVAGVNAKQAIAFSSLGHKNITVTRNRFKKIGLDCISIGGIDNGEISGNRHDDDECYALIFNADPSSNITVSDNFAKTAVNVAGSARPEGLGIDLPEVIQVTVTGNTCSGCASAGIGIF
ncbi:MAG: right-handed parallel beta-helix repeat-containing protein, partial [Proteobacteria bacterium]|nr:right-handed parallel beta-helix repeat-containing protein [Pseudomonadota bacterium]